MPSERGDAPAAAPDPARVTALLADARAGKAEALDALLPLVYAELRRVAAGYLRRERPGQTLQATGLVHEAYLRLMREQHVAWENRAHFCAIAANAMRQILVERARRRKAAKRGGAWARLTLDEGLAAAPEAEVDVEALDEALSRLAARDPNQARLVELRYFGGLTIEETAAVLDVSPATVKRSWMVARAWLRRELEGETPGTR
jgi:RNA polymerase sigma factor (TIGR02999 family)